MNVRLLELSVIIPTYRREQVLIDTLTALLQQAGDVHEILAIDQSPVHEPKVEAQLEALHNEGAVRWIRQDRPSIPCAMNRGVLEAKGQALLFLDDDIVPAPGLLAAHLSAHADRRGDIIAGRVLQPWHDDQHDSDPFTRTVGEMKTEFMGGNFSILRQRLLAIGGFDENFKGAGYRFERDVAERVLDADGSIWYEPRALIRHLHHGSGGTRSRGDHLTSWNPSHPVGAYYYLLKSNRVTGRPGQVLARLGSSVVTRHHLRKPWYIPVTLVSEISGLLWAVGLRLRGPQLPLHGDAAS